MGEVTADEAAAIERAIAALEARVGVQVVAAVVPRSDGYPELAWRAFALGAAIAALVALVIDVARPEWISPSALLAQALAILAAGCLSGGLAWFWPGYARLFLGAMRAAGEVRQCAEGLFLSRELFATPRRDALLIVVSRFERRVVILPDRFYRERVSADEWQLAVDRMTPLMKLGRVGDAFIAGLSAIEGLLAGKDLRRDATASNALPDALLRGEAP
jgi:putative membrane protein